MSPYRQTPLTCAGHTRPVVDLDFSDVTDDGYFVISASKDGKPMLRQGDTGDWIGTFEGHKGAVWGATLNRTATVAATGSADFTAKLWDPILGTIIKTFEHKHVVKTVKFSGGDGNYLLTGSNEKLMRVFDLQNMDSEPTIFFGHESRIKSSAWLPNDRQFLSISEDKTMRLWNTNTPDPCITVKFDEIPTSMEIQKDDGYILVTHGSTVAFYECDSLTLVKEVKTPTALNSASYNAKSKQFVCGGEDFRVYKYDYETGKELESYRGHFGPVHCIRYSPDCELYASGSEDGTLRLWQNDVGGNYGLWKSAAPVDTPSTPIIAASAGSNPTTPADSSCTKEAASDNADPIIKPMQNVAI